MSEGASFEATLRDIVREVVRSEIRAALMEQHARSNLRQRSTSDGYFSIAKAAEFADVAPGTLRRWIRSGRLPTLRAGRVYRIARGELVDFLAREGRSADVVSKARAIVGERS